MHWLTTPLRSVCLVILLSARAVFATDAAPTPTVQADFPPGAGPFPAVVLAPGQGYHMDLPAMRQAAAALVSRGFAVYRFNWSYWTREPKGDRSSDLSAELRDMQAVIRAARGSQRVDAKRVAVGGKSLGSLLAWQAFRADDSLTSALLLTPVCSQQVVGDGAASAVAANYPKIEVESRALLFVLGDHDALCEPKVLFRFAASAKGAVRVSVVSGDHGFNTQAGDAETRQASLQRTLQMVGDAVSDFAAQVEARGR